MIQRDAKTYQLTYFVREPDEFGDFRLRRNIRRIGKGVRTYRRAIRLVYWLRKRGVEASMF